MPKRALYPQTKRHIAIRDDDWDYLEMLHGRRGGMSRMGVTAIVRNIVHAAVEGFKQQALAGAGVPKGKPITVDSVTSGDE